VRLRPRPRLVRAFVADLPDEDDPPEVANVLPALRRKALPTRGTRTRLHLNVQVTAAVALTETAPGGELVVRASVVVANLRKGAAYPPSLHWRYVPWRYEEPSF
jgi:hypothetical protein